MFDRIKKLREESRAFESSPEKTETDEDKKHNYIRRERSSSLSRSYYVGDVSNESVKAKYDNGILSIEIPKEEPKKELTHNVEIQ